MVFESFYATLSDADLKHEANRLVDELEGASPGHQTAVLTEIAVVREEMIDRLRSRGDDDDESGGVREPRVPDPGSGGAQATVLPEHEQPTRWFRRCCPA
jgi:hypothetical protein